MTAVRGAARRAAAVIAVVAVSLAATGMAASPVAAAQPYSLTVDALYRVDPAARAVSVTLGATFRNTTPDRPGSHSLYRTIPIPLQPGATAVTARDAVGTLRVTTHAATAQTLATVTLRTALRYGHAASLTIAYRLRDAATPHVRIRPNVVVIPLWAFGTAGSVVVRLPTTLAAGISGEQMTAETLSGQTVLSSGRLTNPERWQALLTAAGDPTYTTVSRSLPLSGGTVDLRVRAWADDTAWGARTLDLALRALPALQEVIGLPYSTSTPVVISESLPSGTDVLAEPVPGAQEIGIAFDATPFVTLHELAHVWVDGSVASSRWIREGLASQAAAQAAPALRIRLPFDPATEAAARTSAAIPLDEWDATGAAPGQRSPATDAWAYAASWSFVQQLAAAVGDDRLWQVVRAGVAGASGYRPVPGSTASGGAADPGDRAPLESRRFLDLLEEGGPASLERAFASAVLPASARTTLASRSAARTAYAKLLVDANGWPAPDAIRQAMETWRFSDAQSLIARAGQWLVARDILLTDARLAGLSPPDRLATAWRLDGGGAAAVAELRAEQSLVDAYASARASVGGPNPVELLGLAGGPMPNDLLQQASGRFTGGDLKGSAAAIERATALAAGAQASGVVRLAIGAAILAVAVFGVLLAAHRLNRWLRRRARPGVAQPPVG